MIAEKGGAAKAAYSLMGKKARQELTPAQKGA
jgi:hypothetical protein